MKMRDDRPEEWPPLLDKRQIQDMVHGPICLFHPLDRIVDTREFQRLRDLKQLGVTYLVYPCSTHSRFVHRPIGWLSNSLRFSNGILTLNITGQDHLCVSLAALCHDLGHGPFSHLFDGAFREASRAAKYTDSNGRWLPRGRSVERSFLFVIVANDNDSCDVDKFDYLVRDSLSAGIPIPLNMHSLERLMENAKVLPDPHRGYHRICYAKKV
ncbi:hypothetical protein COOONC_11373 [Cooperia oncophora]